MGGVCEEKLSGVGATIAGKRIAGLLTVQG
jgi:hypothetical protein